jgi:hypothetical protein
MQSGVNPYVFNIGANKNVTAKFVQVMSVNVVLNDNTMGSVTSSETPTAFIKCNETDNICNHTYRWDYSVTLTASPKPGYKFTGWQENNQIISTATTLPTFLVESARNLTAVFEPLVLKFPLSGTLEAKKLKHFFFSDPWTPGECPAGILEVHVGVDLQAAVADEVHAAHAGKVKDIFTGQHSEWADAIVVENDDNQFTTVYWHVLKYGNLNIGDHVTKDQQIANVADLGDNTHFHFGIRMTSYLAGVSEKGALPVNTCGTKPAYPDHFINPELVAYE